MLSNGSFGVCSREMGIWCASSLGQNSWFLVVRAKHVSSLHYIYRVFTLIIYSMFKSAIGYLNNSFGFGLLAPMLPFLFPWTIYCLILLKTARKMVNVNDYSSQCTICLSIYVNPKIYTCLPWCMPSPQWYNHWLMLSKYISKVKHGFSSCWFTYVGNLLWL